MLLQTIALFCAVQPMYDALTRLAARAGIDDVTGLVGGYGGVPEAAVVADLWRASRREVALSDVVGRHGFHGPMEGELSSRVWREDDRPLERLLGEYADRPDGDDPRSREAARRAEREELERQLVAASPRAARPVVTALLRRAAVTIPLRGVAKNAFLQTFDVARASARRAGECLAATGGLADPDDVFYLTVAELTGELPAGVGDVVAFRRERRAGYLGLRLPTHWQGAPPRLAVDGNDSDAVPDDGVLTGTGVSAGVVEGIARVVTDPDFAAVEPGDILVAPTTDPSWASVMFISSALVVDIGGMLSHAAIVARELGVPCVVNTVSGSRTIRTGDHLRVDGTAGTVEILKRPAAETA